MAITFNYDVDRMEGPNDGTGTVSRVYWTCTATEGEHTATESGDVMLGPPSEATFIPADQLTPDRVFAWVTAAAGTSNFNAMKQRLRDRLAVMKTPPVVVIPPPWVQEA